MVKLFKIILVIALFMPICKNSHAQAELVAAKDVSLKQVNAVTFLDYPPFGERKEVKAKEEDAKGVIIFESVFEDYVSRHLDEYNFDVRYLDGTDYEELLNRVRRGKADLVYGMYSHTMIYEGIEIIYPSIVSNPITIMMLPSRIGEVKSLGDLKKLKGAINSHEILSDFVNKELKEYDVTYEDDENKIFEMLFTGKVDYVFTSYYFGLIEASKLGLRDKVSFSKQIIWNMPLFVGISKDSMYREILTHLIEKMSSENNARSEMEKIVKSTIEKIERENYGVVPPSYSNDTQEQEQAD